MLAGCGAAQKPSLETIEAERSRASLDKKVARLIGRLEDPELAEAAMEVLMDMGKPAVPHLIKAIDSPERGIATGSRIIVEVITNYSIDDPGSSRKWAAAWRAWYDENKDKSFPLPGPPVGLHRERPAAEVVPPGPRTPGATAPKPRATEPPLNRRDNVKTYGNAPSVTDAERRRAQQMLNGIMGDGVAKPKTPKKEDRKIPVDEEAPAPGRKDAAKRLLDKVSEENK